MRIAFFYPKTGSDNCTETPVSTLAANLPPIGIASCAAVLRKAGHQVFLLDASLYHQYNSAQYAKKILDYNPDYVGFSTITANFLYAYSVCEKIKELRPDIRTIFGGVHVSWGKALILRDYPAIDFVVAGEGEFALLDLVENRQKSQIPGLYYRNGSGILHGPEQNKSTLCKMDDLPFPAYDLLNGFPSKYSMPLFSYPQHPGATVISSRGCVYRCSFCDRSVFHNSFRWNSPEYTYELILWLNREFNVKHILFYDDLFTLNRKRVSRLCSLIRKIEPKITFNCIVRIGHIDEELIKELKSAGCWMVSVGIESGDQKILDSFKDGLSLEAIRRDVEKLYKNGLWVKGLFMMGFPGETVTSMQKTVEFACSLPLKDANVTAFTPFCGSPVYKDIDRLGVFDHNPANWQNMDCVNIVFRPNEIDSTKTIKKQYNEFLRRFYHRPFIKKVHRKIFFRSLHSYWRLLKNAPAFLKYSREIK